MFGVLTVDVLQMQACFLLSILLSTKSRCLRVCTKADLVSIKCGFVFFAVRLGKSFETLIIFDLHQYVVMFANMV